MCEMWLSASRDLLRTVAAQSGIHTRRPLKTVAGSADTPPARSDGLHAGLQPDSGQKAGRASWWPGRALPGPLSGWRAGAGPLGAPTSGWLGPPPASPPAPGTSLSDAAPQEPLGSPVADAGRLSGSSGLPLLRGSSARVQSNVLTVVVV